MSSLVGLPPLPASLSAALADSLTGPPPPPPHAAEEPTYSNVPAPAPTQSPPAAANYGRRDRSGSSGGHRSTPRRAGPRAPLPGRRCSHLEQQLDRLRQQMSELRQMDVSLLYQLWSLNDTIQELKQAVRSPSWDNGYDGSADEEDMPRRGLGGLSSVSERLSSSSRSSLEYGNI